MGHGFGLPHSSGPYSQTYDSQWDPMSSGGTCSTKHSVHGCLGDHTIAFHKDMMGWVPSSRKYTATTAAEQNITLDRLGQPASTSSYLMAKIPIPGSTTQFYTVEARRLTEASYDKIGPIPGDAVVIHKVDTTRGDRLAQVVDSDNNGNTNDSGAMWLPGETFTDAANGVSVKVNGATSSGYDVAINPLSDTTAPTVSSMSPSSAATNVAPNANVTPTFSEPIDPATLTTSTFTLSSDGKTATLDPSTDLASGTKYTANDRRKGQGGQPPCLQQGLVVHHSRHYSADGQDH